MILASALFYVADNSQATITLNQGLKFGGILLQEEKKLIQHAEDTYLEHAKTDFSEFIFIWRLWDSGARQQSIEQALVYLNKNPDDIQIRLSLGQFYFLQKKYALAIQQINKLVTKNPTYVAARTTLIDVYIATKNYTQATTILNKGLALSPHDSSLLQSKQLIQNAQTAKPVEVVEIKPTPPARLWSYIEGGILYAKLTAGYGNWFNQYLKTVIQKDQNNTWEVDALHDYEFA